MRVLKPASKFGLPIAPTPLFAQPILLRSPYGLDASCIRCTCFRNTNGLDAGSLYLFHEPNGCRPDLAGTGDRQAERRHPYDAIQIWRLNPASFPFSIPGLRLFFLSPDFSPALCLNSPYRGFPKGDSCETHRIGFRRSILFVRTIRRPAGFGAGIVDQSFNAARIEAPSEATPLQKTQRQTPAHVT